jgi:predicted HNH restriction endonuclease
LSKIKPLHVHHMSYDHFTREPLTDLIGLCYDCHREVHRIHRAGGRQQNLRVVTLEFVRNKALDRLRKRR